MQNKPIKIAKRATNCFDWPSNILQDTESLVFMIVL